MKNELNFWVVGGDMRQAKLAELLADDGHTVHTFALEKVSDLDGVIAAEGLERAALADCVVLPLPAEGEGGRLSSPLSNVSLPLEELFATLRPGQLLCAGRTSPAMADLAGHYGLTLHDYFRREELAVANAVPMALAVSSYGRGEGFSE